VEQYNNESARRYRMILVDDEDEVRGRISSRISAESGFDVVGTAGNGYDALDLVEEYDPHVVLTDIKMPYIDGIELAAIPSVISSPGCAAVWMKNTGTGMIWTRCAHG
jgi:YesN/AraC family two-component response regulator